MTRLHLASASPRRAELLTRIGAPFTVLRPPDIDETPHRDEAPRHYVQRLAKAKAEAGCDRLPHESGALGTELNDSAVLGADTAVVVGQAILGKPVDDDQALAMLEMLSGRAHWVLSAVCLYRGEECRLALSETQVHFRTLSAARLRAYVATGEGRDKAGAYGIQGLGAALVASLTGSYSGVVGLPLEQTVPLLEWAGIPYWQ